MRIAVLADFHGHTKLAAFRQFLAEAQPDAVLVCGDVQYYEDMPVPFYFTHGNHEAWAVIDGLKRGSYTRRNLVYLRDAEPVQIGPLTVASLGGVPRGDSTKVSPKFFDPDAYERLSTMSGIDIMLSHDTPIHFSNGRRELTCGEYRLLAEVMQPRFWFSGHHHHFDVEHLGATTIIALGKWPHEWVVADVDDATGQVTWGRWSPYDAEAYNRRLPGWRERERAEMKAINAATERQR